MRVTHAADGKPPISVDDLWIVGSLQPIGHVPIRLA
ncbi:hypothetical protein C8J41_103272 [Sphingomonas sp. PP-CC-3G-468]|nr:hypothetical protein C8J41_103272 [Sphingomonas sp. PP-CC-3G-468]